MFSETEKINLKKLAKRTGSTPSEDSQLVLNLRQRLELSSYSERGRLFIRIDRLHYLMMHEVPEVISKLRNRRRLLNFINILMALILAFVFFALVEPFLYLLPKISGEARFATIDSLLNVLTTSFIAWFAVRQVMRDLGQSLVKDLMDELRTLIHLLDMHQLAKGQYVDEETRTVIAEAIILCGKVAAYVNETSDDSYVMDSIKHIESYSELVASRVIKMAGGR